jgi:acid phosphatase
MHYRKFAAMLFCTIISASTVSGQGTVENAKPLPAFDAAERLAGSPLNFLILGDWGTGGKPARKVAQAMAAKFAADGAIAVLNVGDNFYPSGVESVSDQQWNFKFENIYPASELPIPFYSTLGNHDYLKNPGAQVEYTGRKLKDGSITRWTMPARYWTTTHTSKDGFTLRLVMLDTQMLTSGGATDRKAHLAWLDSVLAIPADWKVAVGHIPPFANGMHGNSLGMIRNVVPVFEKHHLDAYISGHEHDVQIMKPVKGVNYVIIGNGSSYRTTRWAGNTLAALSHLGFGWVQFGRDNMLLQILNADGDVTFAVKLNKNK